MLEPGRHADLALKPLHAHGRAERVVQHLERDAAPVAEVVGEVHRGRGGPAQQRLDRVPLGKSAREGVDRRVRYCRAASVGRGVVRCFASHACTSA